MTLVFAQYFIEISPITTTKQRYPHASLLLQITLGQKITTIHNKKLICIYKNKGSHILVLFLLL